MPWQVLDSPSFPIGLLRAAAVRDGQPAPATYHGGLRWAEYLMARTDGEIGPAEYHDVAENSIFHGLGDWVFAGALHDDPAFGWDGFLEYAGAEGVKTEMGQRMREHAAAF